MVMKKTDDVVLVTGSVHVRTETGRKAELIPNQRFRCTSTGDVDIQTVDVYDYISWKDGLLQYKKRTSVCHIAAIIGLLWKTDPMGAGIGTPDLLG